MKGGAYTALIVFVLAVFPMPAQAVSPSDFAHSFYCVVQNIFGGKCTLTQTHTDTTVTYGAAALSALEIVGQLPTDVQKISDFGTGELSLQIHNAPAPESDVRDMIASLEKKIEAFDTPRPATEHVFANTTDTRQSISFIPESQSYNYDEQIDNLWRAISLTNDVDNLGSVTITTPTIASPTLSGTATSETLTVSGTLTAGLVYDKGGHVCNVKGYGAVGDDSTDDYSAITSAISACADGGIVLFPPGTYRISQTIVLDTPTTLEGTYAPRWSYSATPRVSIKPTTPFTGSAIVHVRDKTISGETNDNNGGRFKNISVDGNSYGTDVHGIHFEGLVRDWQLENVDISQTSGNGFRAEQGSGSGNPRGFTINGLWIYSPASHGFRATALNDSYVEDVLVVGGALRGFYLSSMGETKINNSRAVFNALEGLYIDGSSANGGLQFTDFSTDRNDRHGVRISATGTTTIAFNGLLTRRDGENEGSGSETPYAGVALIGTSGNKVAPVIITNLTQIPGVDDGGGGTQSPATGLRAEYTEYVSVDGVLWGVSSAYTNGGNNDNFIIEEDALLKTGYSSVTSALYNQKWVSTSSQLSYSGGNIGVGTTTPSAQLHTTGTVRFANFGSGTLQTDANGNVSVSSDERLKDVQGTYELGLDAVLGIDPILYNWNEESGFDTETLYAGFSAQNVAEFVPEAVGEDKHGLFTLSDRPILAAVVTAMKELWETVTGNQEEIEFLKARVESLEAALGVESVVPTPPEPQPESEGESVVEEERSEEEETESTETESEEPITEDDEVHGDEEHTATVEEDSIDESIENIEVEGAEEGEQTPEDVTDTPEEDASDAEEEVAALDVAEVVEEAEKEE